MNRFALTVVPAIAAVLAYAGNNYMFSNADAATGATPKGAVSQKIQQRDTAGVVLNGARTPVPASKPTSYVDADTFDIPVHPYIGWTVPVRLRLKNVNAPETRSPQCAREKRLAAEATAKVKALLGQPGVTIELTDLDGFDRYDRYLAAVSVNGQDLGDMLVNAGLARPWTEEYEGQTKMYWCETQSGS